MLNTELILRDYQKEILDELLSSFKRKQGKRKIVVLPCGAGKTALFAYMAMLSQDKGKTVWFLVHRRELLDQTIETFKRFEIPLNTIHIGMVGTVARNMNILPKPDFIIFDEAHFSAANTWRKIFNAFPDAFYVGLTATPVRLDGKPLGDLYDELIVGISAHELIERGLLSDYQYWSRPLISTDGIRTKRGDYDTKEVSAALDKADIFGDAIENYKKIANGKKTICYCDSIERSMAMASRFNDAGINAVHFDGNTPDKRRKEIIESFRNGDITVLCNVDLISCGFDVPDCWCCILLRPTQSTALYIQQAMRAMRPYPGKTAIIIDHVNNVKLHGLPDMDREWSLSGKMKKPKGESVKECPKCFFTIPSNMKVCRFCGFTFMAKERKEKYFVNGNLVMLDKDEFYRNMKFMDYKNLKTYEELQSFAKARGYKPGFAYIKAKELGLYARRERSSKPSASMAIR